MSKKIRRDFRLYLTKDLAFKLDALCSQNGIDPVDLVSGAIQHLWLMAEKEIAETQLSTEVGSTYDPEEMDALIKEEEKNTMVVSDEAFDYIAYRGKSKRENDYDSE